MTDKFQPMVIMNKLDEMRKQVNEQLDNDSLLLLEREKFKAMLVALIWVKVEVMAMAISKERLVE